MDYGIALVQSANSWKTVKRAEELGFSHAWFYDSQLLCADIYVAMAAAAVNTSRIKLGAGVLIPSNRIAPVTANGMASLNQLAPGRIICGLGTGFTGRRTMGLKAQKLEHLREHTRIIRALWRGEMTEWEFENKRRKIKFLDPGAGLYNTLDPIPVHFSAFGPKARALTAELADGWCNFMTSSLINDQAREMTTSWRAAGRDAEALYMTCFAMGCVLAEGEAPDSGRAKAQAGPIAACVLHWLVEDGDDSAVPPHLKPLYDEYRKLFLSYQPADARYLTLHKGHLMYVRPDESPLVTGDLIRGTSLTGTVAEIRTQVATMQAAGYKQVAIQLAPGHEEALDQWADAFGLTSLPRRHAA